MPLFSLLATVLSFLFAFPSVAAFSFSFAQAPTQCDNLPIAWSGGTPPFQLSLIPIFGTLRNISIPASAFSNGQGSYAVQIPLTKGAEMMLMMSDATGFNTGGTTNILTVGASQGGSCNTTDPGVSFSYQLNTALQQCRPFTFSDYTAATQPVTITAIVPGGDVLVLTPPVGPTSFTWNAVVARGTSMVFIMTDSQGRPGGVSDIEIATSSDDTTCLDSNSPVSTSSPPSSPTSSSPSTATSGGTSGTSRPSSSAVPSNGFSIAAIAGTVIGGLLFLALAITLGLFFLRKKHDEGGNNNFRRHSRIVDPGMDLAYGSGGGPIVPPYGAPPASNHNVPGSPYPYSPGGGATPYASDPFLDSHPPPGQGTMRSHAPSQYDTSSMYTNTRYAESEVGQFEMPSQYQYGVPPSQTQLYPPAPRNYPPSNAPTSDPFNTHGSTLLPGTEFEPSTPQSQSQPQGSTNRTSTSTSTAQRKAAAAGMTAYKPSRFIIHTDVEDVPPPIAEEVIELPPQYSERHGPARGFPSLSQPGAHAGHPPGDESLLPYS